jgi:hypothetical protein
MNSFASIPSKLSKSYAKNLLVPCQLISDFGADAK